MEWKHADSLVKKKFQVQWSVKKVMLTAFKNMKGPIIIDSKKQSMEWKHADSLVKKKFWAHLSVKKVMLTVFWNMKRPITTDFL